LAGILSADFPRLFGVRRRMAYRGRSSSGSSDPPDSYSLTLAAEGNDMTIDFREAHRRVRSYKSRLSRMTDEEREAVLCDVGPEAAGIPIMSFLASLPPDVLEAAKRGDFADADEFGDPAYLIRR